MNERILELAKQAGIKFPSETAISPSELKFAELIVKKCVEVIDAQTPVWENTNVPAEFALDQATRNVKAYFGVEE